jgi:NAD-dependent DNA ligase
VQSLAQAFVVNASFCELLTGGSALKSSVAFTGRLACMSRTEAFGVVRQYGGTPSPEVTKRTKVLVVGELGWPLLDDGRPSNKLSRATEYRQRWASSSVFLDLSRVSRL